MSVAAELVAANGRASDVVVFEVEIVAFFVEAAELLGVPKSVAAIYGTVFSAHEPLSFSEIESRLNFSKGSVSQGLRVLREAGAVKAIPADGAKGSRSAARERYAPDMELRRLIQRFLTQRLQAQLETGRARLTGLAEKLTGLPAEHREVLQPRLDRLQRWHDRTRALLPVARAFLKLA